jgi:Fic family protein
MARLLHLWFLIQKGYQSALFIPFSSKIEKSRKAYYDAYTTIEQNKKYSNVIDATPFVIYFIENVYNQITDATPVDTLSRYDEVIKSGMATEKEIKLWQFVLSFYGLGEFSTKQLEKDFGDAAYATIRGFVLKFEELGLLTSTKYGARIKYKISK